ncbi:amidohydrolase [Microbacterium sp.]|uniref:amidohydrolase n=1 Tax=Microbacterium sp. TaxID=51671 RepID=UPI0025F2C6EC|nr:amidohydrolase family protein [Microbacterium sp.]
MTDALATADAPADLVLTGGRIHLFDDAATAASSIAIRDGLVVAHDDDARTLAPRARRVIDLDGRTVLPGINDAHLHAAWLGARWPALFFGDHEASHDEDSGPLVTTNRERRAALQRAWRLLASLGITSYTEPGIGPGEDGGPTGCFGTSMLDTYLDLHREGVQTSRVTLLRLFGTIDGEGDLEAFRTGIQAPAPATDDRWLCIPGVKIFADGIPPMRTAWVREPYADGSSGALLTRGPDGALDAFRQMVRLAHDADLQVAVHATGDRSIAEFLSVLEEADAGPRRHPHYVVHADLAFDDLIERMRAIGVGAAVQPLIAAFTHAWASGTLGAERAARAWPLARMIDRGILTTVTSDAPIATPDWRASVDAAVRLLSEAGIADSTASRRALVRRMTVDAARQDGASEWKGTLSAGFVGDLCVLSADPLDPGTRVAGIDVDATVVGGRIVFERGTTPDVDAEAVAAEATA